MAHASDTALLALQGLRLKGRTQPDAIATLYGIDQATVEAALAGLADAGFAQFREGRTAFWMQTSDGKAEGERLMAAELDAVGARDLVAGCYDEFKVLNTEMLALCTRWQVKDVDGEQVINDHTDEAYDAAVIDELGRLDAGVQPIVAKIAEVLDRYGIYAGRFDTALANVRAGQQEWFTRPIMESYHTVWFELHEDFFGTLGIDRASESH
ncbi:MAG: hypothetical protein R2733_15265 [Acidimicrobiales bacterium]